MAWKLLFNPNHPQLFISSRATQNSNLNSSPSVCPWICSLNPVFCFGEMVRFPFCHISFALWWQYHFSHIILEGFQGPVQIYLLLHHSLLPLQGATQASNTRANPAPAKMTAKMTVPGDGVSSLIGTGRKGSRLYCLHGRIIFFLRTNPAFWF